MPSFNAETASARSLSSRLLIFNFREKSSEWPLKVEVQ